MTPNAEAQHLPETIAGMPTWFWLALTFVLLAAILGIMCWRFVRAVQQRQQDRQRPMQMQSADDSVTHPLATILQQHRWTIVQAPYVHKSEVQVGHSVEAIHEHYDALVHNSFGEHCFVIVCKNDSRSEALRRAREACLHPGYAGALLVDLGNKRVDRIQPPSF